MTAYSQQVTVLLSEIADIEAGNPAPQGAENFAEGGVPFVRVQDMGRLAHEKYLSQTKDKLSEKGRERLRLFRIGTVLFTKSGASTLLNQRAILSSNSYVVSHIGTATPHPGILSEWIYYFLLTVDFARLAHGANMPSLPLSRIDSLQIPLVSTNHQRRVVDKVEELFSEVDDGIANLDTALEQLKVYQQAMLSRAFAGELTSLWRKRNNGAPGLTDVATIDVSEATIAKLPTLSDGWKYVSLGELIDEPRYGTSKKCAYDAEGLGVLRIPNIVSGAIDASDLKFAQFDNAEAKAYRLRAGDILVIRSNGSVSIVGRCAVVSQLEEKYLYAGYLIRIRPSPSLVRPAFLHAVLSSHALRVQIEAKAKSTSGVNNINAQELKSLIVPICSLDEQDELLGILSRNLSVADEMSRQIEHQRARAKALRQAILKKAFSGGLVSRRLCLMNMFLHNIGEIDGEVTISPNDSLVAPSIKSFDYVLANPPFGKKSSMTFTNEEGEQESDDLTYNRQEFWATTSNKQLNFVQHIRTMLKTTGRAAVVVPDNVLFEGGAGETVRKKLLENTDLHTILRLPTGIFYANGVKANVIFFDNRAANPDPWTKDVWYYDYRTNIHHTLKKKTMRYEDLADFIASYNAGNRHERKPTWDEDKNPEGRWRKFTYDELRARDKTSLDVFWLKDKSLTDLDNLPEPDELAEEIIENLEAGLNSFRQVLAGLAKAS